MFDLFRRYKTTRAMGRFCLQSLAAYAPRISAAVEYYREYGEHCDLRNPVTFSEKLLWLSLNTYRNNRLVMELSDKYLVQDYVAQRVGPEVLNELYGIWESPEAIDLADLPDRFVLKLSQGCGTNIICRDKGTLDHDDFKNTLKTWSTGRRLYDKMMADIGGVPLKEFKKYYICEKLLDEGGKHSLTDYKFYCFSGVPRAILVIKDRFESKSGAFMSPDWNFISHLSGSYGIPREPLPRPLSLSRMVEIASKLSAPFPFVRVDLYEISGQPIFGEMTFFPGGCVGMQETQIDGRSMGEWLDLRQLKPDP